MIKKRILKDQKNCLIIFLQQKILETLNNIFDLKDRTENINEDDGITSEKIKKEIEEW